MNETVQFAVEEKYLIFLSSSLLTLVGLTLLHFYHETSHKAKLGNQIPGPRTIPFVGNLLIILGIKSSHHIFKRTMSLSRKYGRIVRGWAGWKLHVFIMDPSDAEVILNSQVHIEKSDEYCFFRPWLGNGILISSGDKWRLHRKLIAPTFHQNILKNFMPTFNENSKKVVEKLKKIVGNEFDCHDHMSEATVNILLETAMGFKDNKNNKNGFDYAMAVMRMCDIIHRRQVIIWHRISLVFNFSKFKKIQEEALGIIHGLSNKVLKQRRKEFDEQFKRGELPKPSMTDIINDSSKSVRNISRFKDDIDEIDENDVGEKRRLAFLDLMIETSHYNPKQISDDEIREQVDTIMFEGHDTTAAGSSFTLCMLGCHPEIQTKVYQEQKAIFGDPDRDCTFADTLEMKYLERVIMETIRLYPPVPVIARKVNEDVKLASINATIPKGTTVLIAIYKLHRTPENYANPDKFDPDNFLPEKAANRHFYSFVPFSAGPRSCVGRKFAMLKLKVLLSTIIRNYQILSKVPEKDFQLQGDIILKRSDGFKIILNPRT